MRYLTCSSFFLSLVIGALNCKICLVDIVENPVVTIESGQIRGRINFTVGENISYYFFQGIPYAEPPLGQLRFSPPVKPSKWSGILNTTQERSVCVQGSDPVEGDEDCLFINVYSPSLTAADISVIVMISGGAFQTGGATSGPDYFLEQDIVYVSFNYRLGVFGFLSTEDIAIPGNWGLKDQLMALQWVQTNIHKFGGNASDVTVMGQSAGAASIGYLLQTNKTSGLFNKAILQSGSSLCRWALNRRSRRTAFKIGSFLGVITINSTNLLKRLRRINYTSLQEAASTVAAKIALDNPLEGIQFGPVVEPVHEGALVMGSSDELLLKGDFQRVPILAGMTSNEAAAIGSILDIIRLYLSTYGSSVQRLTPFDLSTSHLVRLNAGFHIKLYYFGLTSIFLSSAEDIIQFISDDQWNRPIRRMVQSLSQYMPVYAYMFSYKGTDNRNFPGVGHNEDLKYLFNQNTSNSVTAIDELMRTMMVKLWSNFAKYGNPTPTLDPVLQNITWKVAGTNPTNINYLNIDDPLQLLQNAFQESMGFYDNIYQIYGKRPHDTY